MTRKKLEKKENGKQNAFFYYIWMKRKWKRKKTKQIIFNCLDEWKSETEKLL